MNSVIAQSNSNSPPKETYAQTNKEKELALRVTAVAVIAISLLGAVCIASTGNVDLAVTVFFLGVGVGCFLNLSALNEGDQRIRTVFVERRPCCDPDPYYSRWIRTPVHSKQPSFPSLGRPLDHDLHASVGEKRRRGPIENPEFQGNRNSLEEERHATVGGRK